MQLLTVAWYRVIALFTLYFWLMIQVSWYLLYRVTGALHIRIDVWVILTSEDFTVTVRWGTATKALFFNFVNTNTFTFVEFNLTIKIGPASLQHFLFKNFIIGMITSFFLNTTECLCRKLTPMIYRTAGHLNYDISFVSLTSRLMAGILDQGCHLTVPRRQGRFLNEKQISLCSLLDL